MQEQPGGGGGASRAARELGALALGDLGAPATGGRRGPGRGARQAAPPSQSQAEGGQQEQPAKPRRTRSRKKLQDNESSGHSGFDAAGGSGGGGAAAGGGSTSGLTWQQEQFLSAAAPTFVPAGQGSNIQPEHQPQQQGRQPRPPRDAGRGGSRQARGRGRGRGGGPEQQQWDQWQHAEQPPLHAGYGYDGLEPQRTSSRQRRRERLPRDQLQQEQQGGGDARPQQLEAAASAAANRAQQRQQAAAAAAEEAGQSSSSEEPGPPGAAELVHPADAQRRQPRHDTAPAAGVDALPSTAGAPPPAEPHPEAPHCLVCCSEMAEVGLGACNHRDVCGQCTLRLRLCYGRTDCSLCKQELKEVIIVPWRPQMPDLEFYLQHPEHVARSARFAQGSIWADRWRRGGRLSSRLLHDLQRRTALACCCCDPGGEAPFARREQLLRHVADAHGQRLCSLCLQEGRLFPLELEAFPSLEALQAHSAAAHPHCAFCRRTFYDDDALWKHMHQAHYSCHVCPPPVAAQAYFNRAPDLQQHMREEHFLCEEPECADCFVAFAAAEELRRHHLERHSARMPRWDASRARTLQLDISYARRGGAAAAAEPGRRRRRPAGPQDVRMLDGGDDAAAAAAAAASGDWPSEYAREADGGLRIIDDAEFPASAAAYHAGSGGYAVHGGEGGWAGRQRQAPARQERGGADEFPSLAAAGGGGGGSGGGGGGAPAARPPPLVKKTAKCPCGRRTGNYAVEEGQEVPALECDAVCQLEGRRVQLAGAFGVEDPAHHVSYFDAHRAATYSGLLLAAAQAHPKFVEGLERELAAFVADRDAKRQSLSAMPREQRAVVHALAEQYGLATAAAGHEPARYIELFKTPSAGIPARLLSRVAPTVPPEEVAALLRESEGHAMRLTDIAMSADVRFYLRQWDGAYRLDWERGGDAAVVRFKHEQDLKAALDVLGGGIRGLFRIDRSWRPKTAVATAQPASSGSSRGWGGGGGGEATSGGGADSSWTAVAVAPPAAQQPQAQQPQASSAAAGEAQRWAVMRGKRAVRPAAPAPAPVAPTGSRNLLAEMTPEHEDVVTSDSSSDSDG